MATYTCECGRKAKWHMSRIDDKTHALAACGQHLSKALGWISKGFEVSEIKIAWVWEAEE